MHGNVKQEGHYHNWKFHDSLGMVYTVFICEKFKNIFDAFVNKLNLNAYLEWQVAFYQSCKIHDPNDRG
jgi:hypothetical protein